MAVIVQKYGGTSVGSLHRIEAVAERVVATRQQGHQVVVVLSAMAGETNRLLSLAKNLDQQPATRELDMLLSAGEQVSIALLAIELIKRGFSALSLLAHQVGILTDNRFGRARIKRVDTLRLSQALEQEQIVIVAGFQGVDSEGNITTLGRGGSDTSAVAIAAALKAHECQIFTDVDGIFTADPRIEPRAQQIAQLTFDEMLVMANLGAKVLQNRAVEYAMHHHLPIRVLNSFSFAEGTLVTDREQLMDTQEITHPVTGICHHQQEAIVTLTGVSSAVVAADIFAALGEEQIEIDMISQQWLDNQNGLICFTIHQDELLSTKTRLQDFVDNKTIKSMNYTDKVVKLSAVGVGMKSHAGVAGQFISALVKENIDIHLVSTSEINISVIIGDSDLTKGVRALHQIFNLSS